MGLARDGSDTGSTASVGDGKGLRRVSGCNGTLNIPCASWCARRHRRLVPDWSIRPNCYSWRLEPVSSTLNNYPERCHSPST